MRSILGAVLSIAMLAPVQLSATETYDLIFKTGTLDDLAKDSALTYARDVIVSTDAEAAAANTGLIKLTFAEDDMADLMFHQDSKHRRIGSFPATVGNPMIMYFVETVVRDMAEHAGGSPFYIRNRLKDSLIQFAEIEDKTVTLGDTDIAAQQITLRPFLKDKNRDKMQGYEDMALTITMSDDVPGWYYSLVASVKGNTADPIYQNAFTLTSEAK